MAEGGLVLTFERLAPAWLDACAEIAATAPDPWSRAVLERLMAADNHLTYVAVCSGCGSTSGGFDAERQNTANPPRGEGPNGARAPERSDAAGGCGSTSGGFDAERQNTANPPRGEGPHGARAPERSDAAGGCGSTSGGFDAERQNTANPPRGEGPHGARAPERSDAAGGQAVGFASFLVVPDAADLEMLAVSGGARRRGVATALLRHSLPQLAAQGAARALLEARQSNTAALALYQKLGFKQLALRPGMYSNPKEDGILMGKNLIE